MKMINIKDLINFDNLSYNWEVIKSIPEFSVLENCEQSPKWHGEGNAFIHTQRVCEEAINICKNYLYKHSNSLSIELLLTSALFHDIGKGVTTKQGKDGRWHSINHEIEGERITRYLLWNENHNFRESVCALVRYHMEPLNIFDRKDYLEDIVCISKRIPSWNLLIKLKMADLLGSEQENKEGKELDIVKLKGLIGMTELMHCYDTASTIRLKGNFLHEETKKSKDKPHLIVYVMIGLPGSGKSTAVSNIAELNKNSVVISRDLIRAELGICNQGEKVVGTQSQEHSVTVNFNMKLTDAAKDGKVIIIDNINLKKEYRDGYKILLSDYCVEWRYYYVEAGNLNLNIERRKNEFANIDANTVFKNMIYKIDWPIPEEYDKFITETNF